MKSNNDNHAAEAPSIGNSPRKQYVVIIERAKYSECTLHVEAASKGEAEETATQLAKRQRESAWNFADCSFVALEARELRGAQRHA